MSILKNEAEKFLLSDYEIDKTIDREEEINKLNAYVFDKLKKGKKAFTVYVYGSAGTGKSYTIKKLLEDLKSKNKKVISFWFNCKKDVKTYYGILIKILKEFQSLNLIKSVPLRGFGTGFISDMIKGVIEKNSLKILVVADEINQLRSFRDIDDLLYSFLEYNYDLKNGEAYLIAISNDPRLDMRFSSSVSSRLSIRIHFSKYNPKNIFLILREFAKISLKDDSYTNEDLMKIAKFVGNETGSARDGKIILYSIAKESEDKIDMSKFADAIDEKNKLMYQKDLEKLPFQEKLTLLSIILACEKFEKLKIKYSLKKGLRRFILNPKIYPTIQKTYETYSSLCKDYCEEVKHINTFRLFIKDLERQNLISCDIKSFGRGRGITTILNPSLPVDLIKPLILKSLKL